MTAPAPQHQHAGTARWSCDMCRRHCVHARDGFLIGTFTPGGNWKAGNDELVCGECVDALTSRSIETPEGLLYDPERNRSVSAEGLA